jgi:hypothetical protein
MAWAANQDGLRLVRAARLSSWRLRSAGMRMVRVSLGGMGLAVGADRLDRYDESFADRIICPIGQRLVVADLRA